MEPKRSKYDTNPLDEGVAGRAQESFGQVNQGRPGPPTEEVRGGPTREVGRAGNDTVRFDPGAEAPTRRIDDEVTSYPSIFVPPKPREQTYYDPPKINPNIYQPPPVPPPSIYQPPPFPITVKPGSNKVAGLNVPERWAKLLPYAPGYIGAIEHALSCGARPGFAAHDSGYFRRIYFPDFDFGQQLWRGSFSFRRVRVSDCFDDSRFQRQAASHRAIGRAEEMARRKD